MYPVLAEGVAAAISQGFSLMATAMPRSSSAAETCRKTPRRSAAATRDAARCRR